MNDEYISRENVLKAFNLIAKNPNKDYQRGMQDTIDCLVPEVIADIPSADVQPVNQWISCKDKMPEEYQTVLVYEKNYGVMIGEFDTKYFIAIKSGLILQTTNVTHWQSLPEPPKDGDTE